MLITKNELKKIILETINEVSLASQYEGFLISDIKSKKIWKSKYHKNIKNRKVEDSVIAKISNKTGQPRSNFWIYGFIRKGEWNKFDNEEI